MIDQLPILLVLLPFLGGLFAVFMGKGLLPWYWACLITALTFLNCLYLYGQVQEFGVVEYFIGSWPAEYGIAYRIDAMNGFVLLVVSFIAFVSTVYAGRSIDHEIPRDRGRQFYALWLLFICGLLGITITGDAFNVYVMLEISSLTVYALIAMGKERDKRALTASLRYLILGSVGASFILLGIGYLLLITGTLNMADMHDRLQVLMATGEYDKTILIAFAFLLTGLSLKMALFPLHMWLPNAYTFAPSAVSGLVAATATKVGVYMAIRFLFTVFDPDFSFIAMSASQCLLIFACIGVLVTGIQAIRQDNVKTVLAYSSLGQICYIVIGFALYNQSGLTGSSLHIMNHALIKGGMFLSLGCVVYKIGGVHLKDLRGLGRKMPFTMAAFTAGGLGLIGFPLTAGFISKWFLVKGALDAGLWPVAAVIMLGSLFALIYVWRIIEAIYFQEADEAAAKDRKPGEAPFSMVLCTWVLIGLSLIVGLWATIPEEAAAQAAAAMLGGR